MSPVAVDVIQQSLIGRQIIGCPQTNLLSKCGKNRHFIGYYNEMYNACRGKSCGDHIFVNPALRLKPCLVVIINNQVL